jgi:hypothetical protein
MTGIVADCREKKNNFIRGRPFPGLIEAAHAALVSPFGDRHSG